MDLKMPEECDTVYPHRKETGNRTDGFGCTVRVQLIKLGEDVSLTVSERGYSFDNMERSCSDRGIQN